jgi:hypothetical protein
MDIGQVINLLGGEKKKTDIETMYCGIFFPNNTVSLFLQQ